MSDDYDKIRESQARAAAAALGGDLANPSAQPTFTADQAHGVPEIGPPPFAPTDPQAGFPAEPQDAALERRVEDAVTKALQGLMGGVGPASFEDALADVDPRDSEAALAMLDWLLKSGRLQRIGVLDGNQGYLFGYVEPKGSTKQGYRPGGTEGDRIVDQAVDQARETGAPRPDRQGMCPKCMTVVAAFGEQIVDETGNDTCPNGGTHDLA